MTDRSVTLPATVRDTVNASMMTGMPMLVTYWDDNGVANTSWRGSTHVHEDGSLAMWIRSRVGGLAHAVKTDARIVLAYRNPHTKSFITFTGEARVEDSEDGNRKIFADTNMFEQKTDPGMNGIGVIVTVRRVAGSLDSEEIAIAA